MYFLTLQSEGLGKTSLPPPAHYCWASGTVSARGRVPEATVIHDIPQEECGTGYGEQNYRQVEEVDNQRAALFLFYMPMFESMSVITRMRVTIVWATVVIFIIS